MRPLHIQNRPIWENGPLYQDRRYYIVFEAIDEINLSDDRRKLSFTLAGRCFTPDLSVEIANHYIKLKPLSENELDDDLGELLYVSAELEIISDEIVRFGWKLKSSPEDPTGKLPFFDKKIRFKNKQTSSNPDGYLFKDFSPMISEQFSPELNEWNGEIDEENDIYTLSTSKIKVILKGYPFKMEIYDLSKDKPVLSTPDLRLDWVPNGYGFSHGLIYSPEAKYPIISYVSLQQKMVDSIDEREHYFGCGEDYGPLDKFGRSIYLDTCDTTTTDTKQMYKPIPFFMSSAGYGVFVHDSVPMNFDFGESFFGRTYIESLAGRMDLFFIIAPSFKKILDLYTDLTGKAYKMPPKWSFGLWMSRISYRSEKEVRTAIEQLREHRVPADVIHIDTDWFENEWECDFKWAPSKFPDPEGMIHFAHEKGFKISLWQLPYINVKTDLFAEGKKEGVFAVQPEGIEQQSGIIDVSNPKAVEWYKNLIGNLFKQGVDVIKVDFGESAYPEYKYEIDGLRMHNLYPLLYNKLQYEVASEFKSNPMIWARSAWAGSQRYPVHWAGDSKATFPSMFTTMRGGLSFGLSGFTFWSHDIGGFTPRPDPELYIRWAQFGLFSSHSRCHGAPPREPWTFGDEAERIFRKYDMRKYRLFPYIYTQSFIALKHGWPFIRPLFFELQDKESGVLSDPILYAIEDEYMFGSYILVAPIFNRNQEQRTVYLPEGIWYSGESLFQTDSEGNDKEQNRIIGEHVIKGPTQFKMPVNLETFPVFIAAGSAIWIGPELQYLSGDKTEICELHIFSQGPILPDEIKVPLFSDGKMMEFTVNASGDGNDNIAFSEIPEDFKDDKIKIIVHTPE